MLRLQLFPLNSEKRPIIKGWDLLATDNETTLKRWKKEYPNCYWGCACGPSKILVLDIDPRHGGEVSLLELELKIGKSLPKTYEVITPRGGRHLYYIGSAPSSIGTLDRGIGPGLDIKSIGGYVACPPTPNYIVANRLYPKVAPRWFEILCTKVISKKSDKKKKRMAFEDISSIERASRWLMQGAPASIEGKGGNDNAYRVACRIKDMGPEERTCLHLMLEYWNSKCQPPWSSEELKKIVKSAYCYSVGVAGIDAPGPEFDNPPDLSELVPSSSSSPPLSPLNELNQKHAVVVEGGKLSIMFLTKDPAIGGLSWTRVRPRDFIHFYANRTIQVGKKIIDLGTWWMKHPKRRQCEGTTLDPSAPTNKITKKGLLNLWQGWGIEPIFGKWDLIREELICQLIANGDTAISNWVLNWIAFMVQQPLEPPGVALVLRGDKGSGKGTLGNALLQICGRHGFHVSSPDQLTGRFNGHLESKILLFADEAFWAGDKRGEGRLKSIITERLVGFERKGLDATLARNTLHVLMASNEDWVVPASMRHERRFCVLDVSSKKIGDWTFWRQLHKEMMNGGLNAMLYDLLNRDIGRWHPREAIPKTEALLDQMIESMPAVEAWWRSVLYRQEIPDYWLLEPKEGAWSEGSTRLVDKDAVFDSFVEAAEYARRRGEGPRSKEALGRWLRKKGISSVQVSSGDARGKRGWLLPGRKELQKIEGIGDEDES